jgi:hypothetical protein
LARSARSKASLVTQRRPNTSTKNSACAREALLPLLSHPLSLPLPVLRSPVPAPSLPPPLRFSNKPRKFFGGVFVLIYWSSLVLRRSCYLDSFIHSSIKFVKRSNACHALPQPICFLKIWQICSVCSRARRFVRNCQRHDVVTLILPLTYELALPVMRDLLA